MEKMKEIDNEQLRKLIQENPELPLVFYVSNDNICEDYGMTVFEGCNCKIGTVYMNDVRTYDDLDDILDYYIDYFSKEEQYKEMSAEEYGKAIAVYINENVRHYKAIIIEVGY